MADPTPMDVDDEAPTDLVLPDVMEGLLRVAALSRDNRLTDAGVDGLVAAALQHGAQLRVLKLHKNRLSSNAIPPLMELIQKSREPVVELHLSHNMLGSDVILLL